MALPASDAFTNANGTALTTHDASWTLQTDAGFRIQSNGVSPHNTVGSLEGGAYWNADTPDDNQYAEVVFTAGGIGYIGPAVRMATGADSRYGAYTNGTDSFLFKIVAGTFTQLGATGPAFSNGDTLRIEANGTTIRLLKNGAESISVTDSSLASGRIGITGYSSDTNTQATSWTGGNLSAGSSTTVTPTTGALTINGRQGATNVFTNVRIREVFINEAGSPLANMTGMSLLVWYSGSPVGAPDLSYSAVTTDANGTMSYSLATGSLAYNQAIFYVATDGSSSLSAWTCARMTPTYT
jgi:hypothetical protein